MNACKHLAHATLLGTCSILMSAFALWGVVQIAPGLPDNAVLGDVVIVLLVVDLTILVSPCSKNRSRRSERR